MRKVKTWIPFLRIRKGPLQALTNAGTKLLEGSVATSLSPEQYSGQDGHSSPSILEDHSKLSAEPGLE